MCPLVMIPCRALIQLWFDSRHVAFFIDIAYRTLDTLCEQVTAAVGMKRPCANFQRNIIQSATSKQLKIFNERLMPTATYSDRINNSN